MRQSNRTISVGFACPVSGRSAARGRARSCRGALPDVKEREQQPGPMENVEWLGGLHPPVHGECRFLSGTGEQHRHQIRNRQGLGAEGGSRTHTGREAQRFLRPSRLPFRHFGACHGQHRARAPARQAPRQRGARGVRVERKTGVEPATSSLARRRSTTELLPLAVPWYGEGSRAGNGRRRHAVRPQRVPGVASVLGAARRVGSGTVWPGARTD